MKVRKHIPSLPLRRQRFYDTDKSSLTNVNATKSPKTGAGLVVILETESGASDRIHHLINVELLRIGARWEKPGKARFF